MKGIKKILVPMDFADCSKYAFYYALDIAIEKKAEIFLLHVIDLDLVMKISALKLCSKVKVKKVMENIAKNKFDKLLKESAKKLGILNIKEIIEEGNPFLKILNKAKDLGVDLIVMGSFGASPPMKSFLFGSTAEKILKGSKIPVLYVPMPQAIEGNF